MGLTPANVTNQQSTGTVHVLARDYSGDPRRLQIVTHKPMSGPQIALKVK